MVWSLKLYRRITQECSNKKQTSAAPYSRTLMWCTKMLWNVTWMPRLRVEIVKFMSSETAYASNSSCCSVCMDFISSAWHRGITQAGHETDGIHGGGLVWFRRCQLYCWYRSINLLTSVEVVLRDKMPALHNVGEERWRQWLTAERRSRVLLMMSRWCCINVYTLANSMRQ